MMQRGVRNTSALLRYKKLQLFYLCFVCGFLISASVLESMKESGLFKFKIPNPFKRCLYQRFLRCAEAMISLSIELLLTF